MSEYVYAGLTSQTIDLFLQDSSSTIGAGLSGLVFNSAGLVASYRKGATGSRVAITLATQTVGGAFSSGGFVEIDATNMKGIYRFDLVNAMVDTEGFTTLYIFGATNLAPVALRIDCRPLPADMKKINAVSTSPVTTVKAVQGLAVDGVITTLTGHTPQTGDSFARIGAAGAGLTNIDLPNQTMDITGNLSGSVGSVTGLTASNLDATITSRMATYTQPTGFLAASFPTDPADQSLIISATDAVMARLGAPAGASMSADIAALPTDADVQTAATAALDAISPTALSRFLLVDTGVLLGLPGSVGKVGVDSMNGGVLRTHIGLAAANLDTQLGDLPTNAELATALGTSDDATLAAIALSKVILDKIDTGLVVDGAVWQFTVNMLELGPAGGAGSESDLLLSTTIASVTSQTVLVLTAGSADNDAYNNQLVVITDASTSTQKASVLVSDYVGSTKTLTLAAAPVFTVAATDGVKIFAIGQNTAVNVLPATGIVADRSAGTTLLPAIGETISQAVTVVESDGTTAVDLSGKTLAIIFETMDGTDVAVVASGNITISGADDNIVTFAYPSAVTASVRTLRFAIRDAAAPLTMYLQGVCSVVSAPVDDP